MTATPKPDPYDLDALRAQPLEDVHFETVLTTVPVHRPGRQEFFRVHSGRDFVIDSYVLEHERELERVTYWVAPHLVPKLLTDPELCNELRPVRLYTAINKHGTVFLWPAKLPREDAGNTGRAWHQSALLSAEAARQVWVKLVGNKALGAYEYVKARGELGEPQWPDKTYRELIELAFRERTIDGLDHPVLRELNGYH